VYIRGPIHYAPFRFESSCKKKKRAKFLRCGGSTAISKRKNRKKGGSCYESVVGRMVRLFAFAALIKKKCQEKGGRENASSLPRLPRKTFKT